MRQKVLLADDDSGMRLVLRKAIEKFESFTIAGEAEDGTTALQLFEEMRTDVVFLDVEMPMMSGIECARRIIDINPKTIIIFATAHEEYMPEAFEVYAFDYLVKPFKMDRLMHTLERIIQSRMEMDNPPSEKNIIVHTVAFKKLMIRNREGISLVDMDEIILIQREERSTVIYTEKDRFSTSEGLSEIEDRLDGSVFFRCHKSYIINLSRISRIYPYGRWTYIVKLKGIDKDALLTHDKYEELEKLFN